MALAHRTKLNCSLPNDYFNYLKEIAEHTGKTQGDILTIALKLMEKQLYYQTIHDIESELDN